VSGAINLRTVFGDAAVERVAKVVPRHLSPERVVQVASAMVYRTPGLQKCDPNSVLAAVLQASELGLDISPAMGEAYLIPRWNGKSQSNECQFQPGYKGLVKLALQSGQVAMLQARLVREGEPFTYRYTPDLEFLHEPSLTGQAPVVAVYAYAKLANGETMIEVMTADEVESIRARSQAGKTGPWVTDWNEMARKTALKRICKALPRSLELARAIEADDSDYRDRPASVVSRPPRGPRARGVAGLSHVLANRKAAAAVDDDAPIPDEIETPGDREPGED
jgi:recombination protein RecT